MIIPLMPREPLFPDPQRGREAVARPALAAVTQISVRKPKAKSRASRLQRWVLARLS